MKMLVSSRFYMHERRFVVVYMECELEVQVYEPIQFDSIDCVLCRATSLQKETTSSPCRRSLLAKIRQKFW